MNYLQEQGSKIIVENSLATDAKICPCAIRAWDKGPIAEVESSHGRFNPTKNRVKSTLKSTFLQKSSKSRVQCPTVTSTSKVDF